MTYKHQNNSEFPRITEAALEELRGRLGVKISRDPEPWCFEATREIYGTTPTELAMIIHFGASPTTA